MRSAKTFFAITGVLALGFVTLSTQAGVTFTCLVSFNQTNGASPNAGLIQGMDGNFYGTTFSGGPGGNGTIFQMTPSGVLTKLVSFNNTNGAGPRAGLVQAMNGNLYGTTYNGGSNNFGTVFQATTNGALTTLVTFDFTHNGAFPIAGLIQGQDGNFYGTTAIGGTNSGGTVFQVMTNGTLTTLVSFGFAGNAANSPYAGLVQDSDGSLYGTTYQGGTVGSGYGTIFELTTNGTSTTLVSFGNTNGANPFAGLIRGSDDNFYGTTFLGGTNGGYGTVFKLATNGTLTTLMSFNNTNGANPQAGLVQDPDGNFYGTTSYGGAYTNQSVLGNGTVFQLKTNGTLTTLVSFNGTNGALPQAGLVQSADGSFYGTTASGGTNGGYGTVFRFSIPTPPPPNFLTVQETDAMLTLTWSATVGQSYQMQFKTNLNQTIWNNLDDALTATNPIMTTYEVVGPDPQRFYRVQLSP
jgi:uncharacterized repeat protein (TIGR03803 family)